MLARRLLGIVVLGALLGTSALPNGIVGPAAAVTVGPGVIFQPSDSWANISFSTQRTFTTIRVDATGVTFDSVRFGAVKTPSSLPRASIVIGTWTPLQTVVDASVVRFNGDSAAGSSLQFSLSNVTPAREYILDVDSTERDRRFSDANGFVSFEWSSWSVHDLHVRFGAGTGGPPPPTPLSADFSFVPSAPEADQVVSFSAAASGGTPPYVFSWNFGDGSSGSGISVTHSYPTAGTYTVTLTTSDVGGQTKVVTKLISVSAPPPPPPTLATNFTLSPTSPVAGESVTFSAAASGGTPPYSFSWDFGDGGSSSGSSVAHSFSVAGTYDVVLTMSDAASGVATVGRPVDIGSAPPPPPTLATNFTHSPTNPVVGQSISFSAAASGGTPPYSFAWDFGDGAVGSGSSVAHAYSAAQTYDVVLRTSDGVSAAANMTRQVVVSSVPPPPPTLAADFAYSPTIPVALASVVFSAAITGGTTPYAITWEFGDSEIGFGSPVAHVYSSAGTYPVNLTVDDSGGETVSISRAVTVAVAPPPPPPGNVTAAFIVQVNDRTVTFGDRTTSAAGLPIETWFWSFGDGTSSREQHPVHAYEIDGFVETFTVILVACDSEGRCDSESHSVTLFNWLFIVGAIAVLTAIGVAIWLAFPRRRRRRRADAHTRSDSDPD